MHSYIFIVMYKRTKDISWQVGRVYDKKHCALKYCKENSDKFDVRIITRVIFNGE